MGLTLKRYDDEKEIYWLAGYRYLSNTDLCKKMSILIQIFLLGNDFTIN